MTVAGCLLAAALLIAAGTSPRRAYARARSGHRTAAQGHRSVRRRDDPLADAFTLDVLATCLRAGMPVSAAASASAPSAPPELARLLGRAADLLALGADPAVAWSDPAVRIGDRTAVMLRLARRSAASGSALAEGFSKLAGQYRDDAADMARAAAERASVLIAGPLGLCYLPAFVCLGIVPVVAGLAGDVLRSGVL